MYQATETSETPETDPPPPPLELPGASSSTTQEFTPLIGAEKWWQRIPKRHILAIMAFFGFFNVYALRVNLSVAIVAMSAQFEWSPKTQGVILASFFYGYIVTQIPGGYFAGRFGGRALFAGGIFCTACLTILTPFAAQTSPVLLIIVRVLEGLCEGVTFPAMHTIWGKWAPPMEKTKLATLAWSGTYIGTVVAMPLSGILAEKVSWHSVFYCFGVLAIIWSFFWIYLIRDSPDEHETITSAELEYLHATVGPTMEFHKHIKTPWLKMFTSLPVLAIVLAHFSENWGFYTMLTELPTFLGTVLHYDLTKTGLLSAVPYVVVSLTVPIGGQLADFIRRRGYLSTTVVRKIFTCGAFLSQALFMCLAAVSHNPTGVIICLVLGVGLGGFSSSGFSVNHLDVAPRFAGILMGISNCFATIPGIVSPTLSGQITVNKTQEEWHIIFFITSGIYLVGALVYALCASGERQKWAEFQDEYSPVIESQMSEDMPFGN